MKKPQTTQNSTAIKRRQEKRTVVEGLTTEAARHGSSRILLPIGNDYFNAGSLTDTAKAVTPEDKSGRWQETFACVKELVVAHEGTGNTGA